MTSTARADAWPELPYNAWKDTCDTLHLWTQIVGKIRLARTPWVNHSWHVTLYVTPRGLTTSPIPDGYRTFEIAFDLFEHNLEIVTSDGGRKRMGLKPQSVAEFYAMVTAALAELGIVVPIGVRPCEIPGAIPFDQDHTHCAYDADYVDRFRRVLIQADRVLKQFRTGFIGKCSPCHFFWGSFDLALTRFSGRAAPSQMPGAPGVSAAIMQEAYSHEVSSAGFWPGGAGIDYAAFYSYAYPEPGSFRNSSVRPAAAFYSEALKQFLLPYDAVRTAPDPDAALLAFFQSTYEAAADGGKWDRAALECRSGRAGTPRSLV
jgi:hypothetical protein